MSNLTIFNNDMEEVNVEDIKFEGIFKNEEYKKEGFEHELALLGLSCFYMAVAIKAADGNNNTLFQAAMNLSSNIGFAGESWAYNDLRNAVMSIIALNKNRERKESRYYDLFERHLRKVLGDGAHIIAGKSDEKNRPDSWISFNGNELPVEMKRDNFDGKALKQLRRYIDAFHAPGGIAVGRSMTVECPSDVIFVKTETLDYLESLETKKITMKEIFEQ